MEYLQAINNHMKRQLLTSLPHPDLYAEDFNSHNALWGFNEYDTNREVVHIIHITRN